MAALARIYKSTCLLFVIAYASMPSNCFANATDAKNQEKQTLEMLQAVLDRAHWLQFNAHWPGKWANNGINNIVLSIETPESIPFGNFESSMLYSGEINGIVIQIPNNLKGVLIYHGITITAQSDEIQHLKAGGVSEWRWSYTPENGEDQDVSLQVTVPVVMGGETHWLSVYNESTRFNGNVGISHKETRNWILALLLALLVAFIF